MALERSLGGVARSEFLSHRVRLGLAVLSIYIYMLYVLSKYCMLRTSNRKINLMTLQKRVGSRISYLKKCLKRRLARPEVSQRTSRKDRRAVSQGQMSCNRRLARTGVSTPTCLPTSVPCLFIFPAFCALIVPSLVRSAFYKLPAEDSRKHTSRKVRGLASIRLARPEVSQRTSCKDRLGSRNGRCLATDVSQGLAYLLLLVFLLLFRACSSSQHCVR